MRKKSLNLMTKMTRKTLKKKMKTKKMTKTKMKTKKMTRIKTMSQRLRKLKKRKRKRRRKLKKFLMNLNNLTKQNQFGWENLMRLPRMSTLHSINLSQMIGKNTWLSSISLLKVNLNSKLFYLSPRELHSIFSKIKRRKIILSSMSEESSLWMTVRNLFQNGLDLLRELSILKIFLWTFQEKLFNKIKF